MHPLINTYCMMYGLQKTMSYRSQVRSLVVFLCMRLIFVVGVKLKKNVHFLIVPVDRHGKNQQAYFIDSIVVLYAIQFVIA